ncbi:hypothetical protein HS99_0001615 [Kitasatospora aureofaciens]|uniref:Uncharacterized protein n=1 Tax=Kitasatospora aureofaciens TaxID=1894 RepID=A0A1E7NFH5_KITAU|nr:hypothetical protein [Kitasatospora aureofaciens]OEV39424.1 hypothetical protein HS99_0001615 [Kitasatospora aureofaciens]QEV03337.1 hypothetical protein CP971_32625 [Streptomyces viridifaciens]UKZ10026.1 hypothetical protein BOQ63_039625 [Streptomyces viridifaciens]
MDWPVAQRCEELFGLLLAGRLDQKVPAIVYDPRVLLMLSQAYGPECSVVLAVEHRLALHIHADPDAVRRRESGPRARRDGTTARRSTRLTGCRPAPSVK